jgi:hypothetical protein
MEVLRPASPGYHWRNDYVHENVANLSADTRSVLNLYRALIELRKATPELVAGSRPEICWSTGENMRGRRF